MLGLHEQIRCGMVPRVAGNNSMAPKQLQRCSFSSGEVTASPLSAWLHNDSLLSTEQLQSILLPCSQDMGPISDLTGTLCRVGRVLNKRTFMHKATQMCKRATSSALYAAIALQANVLHLQEEQSSQARAEKKPLKPKRLAKAIAEPNDVACHATGGLIADADLGPRPQPMPVSKPGSTQAHALHEAPLTSGPGPSHNIGVTWFKKLAKGSATLEIHLYCSKAGHCRWPPDQFTGSSLPKMRHVVCGA